MANVKKSKSRWKAGNIRYPSDASKNLGKYREKSGWFRGARVTRR